MRPVSKHFGLGWNGAALTQQTEARRITGSPKARSSVMRSRIQLEAITVVVTSSLLLLGCGVSFNPGANAGSTQSAGGTTPAPVPPPNAAPDPRAGRPVAVAPDPQADRPNAAHPLAAPDPRADSGSDGMLESEYRCHE